MTRPVLMTTARMVRRRSALGLFAVVWLNFVLQPCAMAISLQQEDNCAHCPPAHEQAMPAHHGNHRTVYKASCAMAQMPCCGSDRVSVDARTGQLKLRDAGELPVMIVSDVPEPRFDAAHEAPVPDRPPDLAGVSPPLNILFCVYLK